MQERCQRSVLGCAERLTICLLMRQHTVAMQGTACMTAVSTPHQKSTHALVRMRWASTQDPLVSNLLHASPSLRTSAPVLVSSAL